MTQLLSYRDERRALLVAPYDADMLRFMAEYADTYGFPPNYREMCKALGISSTNTAQYHVRALMRGGFVHRPNPKRPVYTLTERGWAWVKANPK